MKGLTIPKLLQVTIIVSGLSLAVVSDAAETQYEKAEREAAEHKMTRIQVKLKQEDTAIRFYGIVLDQYGQPVRDAEVRLHVQQFSLNMASLFGKVQRISAKTDPQGRFNVQDTGRQLYVDEINKEGYEYSRTQNTNRFQYSGEGQIFVPDCDQPVIFRMRKKDFSPGFVISERYLNFEIQARESGKTIGRDFIKRQPIKDIAKPVFNSDWLTGDLQVKATLNTNDATWSVGLSSGDPSGGIIVLDQLLFVAPETGYQPEYIFQPEDTKAIKMKYVYLKSRNPSIFTRFEMESVNATKEFFRLSGKSVTNPYGDRNFEEATDLPYAVTKQLTEEVKASFRRGERPTQPDLPKLIKEAKEKAVKSK